MGMMRVVAAMHLYRGPERPLVVKFGGTSLGTPARMRRAARRVAGYARDGRDVVVVVSAMGRRTDQILRWVSDLCGPTRPAASARDVDRAVATGEELSAGLMSAALGAWGVRAAAMRGAEAGIRVAGDFGAGRIGEVNPRRVRALLSEGVIPVIAGFQGERDDGELVTLERGGSDITAVALAAALGSAPCHVVTDVDAVYAADPRVDPGAERFTNLTHDEMLALAEAGAHVLHSGAARLAHARNVPLRVYSYRAPLRRPGGTRVGMEAVDGAAESV
jgi:aspartate kinase